MTQERQHNRKNLKQLLTMFLGDSFGRPSGTWASSEHSAVKSLKLVPSKILTQINKIAEILKIPTQSHRFKRRPSHISIPPHPNYAKGAVNRQPGFRADDSENPNKNHKKMFFSKNPTIFQIS